MANYRVFELTLVTDTSAYANNDVLAVPQAIDDAAFGGVLESVVLLDEADQGVAIDLVFFRADATLGTINAAVSISDADAANIIGVISIAASDYSDMINSQVATVRGLGLIMKTSTPYIAAIVRSGTPTYAADSLKLKLGFVP